MTTHSLGGTKLNDQMIIEAARRILKAPAYRGERAEKQLGELLGRKPISASGRFQRRRFRDSYVDAPFGKAFMSG